MESISARRKYNAPERRRQLADAAIEVLGNTGIHGLSHPKVDRHAGVPPGTTSFYFRTRKALILGITERMTEHDVADLSMLTEVADDADAPYAGTAGFAQLVMMSNVEPYLTRSRARYELALLVSREPELAEHLLNFAATFYSLAVTMVREWHGPAADPDPAVLEEQAVMVLTFINGVMLSFVHGAPVVADAEHLDRWIQVILNGFTR